jgi:hypothetical protein
LETATANGRSIHGPVREIERRLQIAAKVSNNVPEWLPQDSEQFDDHIKLHFDLTAGTKPTSLA